MSCSFVRCGLPSLYDCMGCMKLFFSFGVRVALLLLMMLLLLLLFFFFF